MAQARISVVLPVKAPTPYLRAMTEFCIKTMREHAWEPFELIVCEVGDPHMKTASGVAGLIDKHIHFDPPIGGVKEINAGIDAANGEFVVTAGNDIIVPPNWDAALLQPFERKDCGITSLSAIEPNYTIGPVPQHVGHPQMPDYVEGMFSPFNMFRKGWRYDEIYKRIYQDSDLIMRIYEAGLRAYRSCKAHVTHFGSVTNTMVDKATHDAQVGADERIFYQRWAKSPLLMFGMIRCGSVTYGREYEAWLKQINLHYDPAQPQ